MFGSALIGLSASLLVLAPSAGTQGGGGEAEPLSLPAPSKTGRMSLEEALSRRRSVREFAATPLTLEDLSQLLWAAQGVTDAEGRRTTPSAGGLYGLELYGVLPTGVYHYEPGAHRLVRISSADLRAPLDAAALGQGMVRQAPATFVIAGVYERIERKYGRARGPRYVHMEAGHAAQNLLLEAVARGLGSVPVGAFDDARVQQTLGLPDDHKPLYLLPVGRPRA